jgi:hypothetical protein
MTTKMRLRILSYEGEFGRIFYVVNVKTDKDLEILKSFINKKDAEAWKQQQEQHQSGIASLFSR